MIHYYTSDMGSLVGGCYCGSIRYEVSPSPESKACVLCHCRDCQRLSGSAFSMNTAVRANTFRFTGGEPKWHTTPADSGNIVPRPRCGECGTIIYSRPSKDEDHLGDTIYIKTGTLDDPSEYWDPKVEIFINSCMPPFKRPGGTKQMEGM